MLSEFPELILVAGHIYDARYGKQAHWWLKTVDGDIIDPTASQFPLISHYEEWKPGDEVRVGKCMNCGITIWRKVTSLNGPIYSCCSDECGQQVLTDLNQI